MATPVIMPRQGQSVESCILSQWHKKKGDTVQEGDLLFTYETDKATFEETSKVSGEILEVYFQEDDDVPCLTNVCVIGAKGEDFSEFNPHTVASDSGEQSSKSSESKPETLNLADVKEISGEDQPVDVSLLQDSTEQAVSPRAKALAKKSFADLRYAAPTGPKNRVIERDVRALIRDGKMATPAAGLSHPAGIEGTGIGGRVSVSDLSKTKQQQDVVLQSDTSYEEKHSNIRKLIAKAMHDSLNSMAQLTLDNSFDATDIMRLRANLKKAKTSGFAEQLGISMAETSPTLNDIILFAVSRVLKNHRLCNAHYYPDKMVYFNTVNLGMAVDTPRGLMVPTIFGADRMTIADLSIQAKSLASDCQKGTISPDYLKGGTFTVTNLGTLGIESFTPVINPPQTCILGVNTITTAVKEVEGKLVPYQSMKLSLTFDHRALDGAPAARFLRDLKEALENFSILLMA